jgi:outer membrane receptor protein involved in Fe transport
MVRSFLLTITLLLLGAYGLSAQTILTGKVTDSETGETLIGASVKITQGTTFIKGGVTNYDGEYRLPLNAGTYTVEISYTGFKTSATSGVQVLTNRINFYDVKLASGTLLEGVIITEYKVPLIKKDETSGGQTLTSESIKNLPTRNVNAIVATTAGATSIDGGGINIKGSRSNGTNFYVDGIRVSGVNIPAQDIEQLQVITGGIGAEYGDVTGGVVSLVTKGPASAFSGGIDVENSHGLDAFGYLLTTANVSGPLIKRKKADGTSSTLMGFRLSGQYLTQKDNDPQAFATPHAKEDVLKRLYDHPLKRVNGNILPSAEFLTNDSVDFFKARPFEASKDINLTGKLDFRLTDNIDLSVTGTFADEKDQFTSTGTNGFEDQNWMLLNSQNNPTEYNDRWSGIARFRHRLGSESSNGKATDDKRIAISNAYYQLQFGFERGHENRYDPRHKDRLFDYGYIGQFDFDYTPVGGRVIDTTLVDGIKFQQVDTRERFKGYQAGYDNNGTRNVPNQGLANYNEFANNELYSSYLAQNGTFSSVYNGVWSNSHRGISSVYNRYSKNEKDVLTISVSSGFDLKLGNTGTHNIQFGLLNEQRKQSDYVVSPSRLWNLAQQKANAHINGLDTTVVLGKFWDPFLSPFIGDSLRYFQNSILEPTDQTFYEKVREIDGTSLNEYINVHKFRPDQMSLSMFSSQELTNAEYVSYYGYDYLGNKQDKGITFNDFFTSKKDGVRTFPVAAQQPLYQAAYIKDKFTFKDIIFSLGLRVERFDLNTKVMKDPYSLYEVISAKEFFQTNNFTRPAGIGDDFKVYVNSKTDPAPKAYRDGDVWYNKSGVQQNDGNLIFGSGVVTPFLKDTITGDEIRSPDFNPNSSFKDYEPQILWMPRLAFSFPISDNANFFAHYDILVQRPPSNWEVSPLDYYYFNTASRTPENNANLKPERVVDYEVGFQQKLNSVSALKFSAYYREMRDMIQLRTLLYIPVLGSRTTFDNVDFGTTKGFTLQYDLRRTQNLEMRMAYTLQFADGTGSDAESQRGLTKFGNIRTLFPLNFDERHNLSAILDYRFSDGKRYSGPRVAGKDILSNFGVNMQVTTVSGRPYTAKEEPVQFGAKGTLGSINGNRLPWRANLDLRVDKSFELSKNLNLNVYFRVTNLLDRRNVTTVYGYTGDPRDDGYLATAEGQSIVNGYKSQGREQAFLSAYSWSLLNPNNFTQPRRMYVGAVVEF